jgi:flagellin
MNKRNQNDNLRKLSTGLRITRAADDAAGLAISEKFKAYIRSTRQAKRNAGDSISMIQTAEGGLGEVSSILIRMRELSIQAASDTIGSPERNYTDVEYQELKNEIQRISKATSFNGKTLLDGKSGVLEFQIGQRNDPLLDRISFDFSQANATAMALGIDSSSLGTKVGAQQSISVLDDALIRVNGIRAKMGAAQNRLQSVINNLSITDENMSEANSRVRDIDVASETAKLAKNNILVQSGVSVLSQTNNSPSVALKLLG